MKNIFVLPTDRPSFLFKDIKDNLMFNKDWIEIPVGRVNQNIYITSDEEIKEGDWVIKISSLYKVGGIIQKYSFIDAQFEDIIFKKIILTIDQDLIKYGVQAIDDEFLQWFVKNVSCERVEIDYQTIGLKDGIWQYNYKIIIPSEKPKPIWKQIIEDCGGNEAFMEAAGLKPKQETLEELAKNTTKKYINEREKQTAYLEFINGYQLAKEQDKNKYSEEDMMEAVRFGMIYKSDSSKKLFEKKGMAPTEVLKKWFDKVKKK
jgi:hypothetical protein